MVISETDSLIHKDVGSVSPSHLSDTYTSDPIYLIPASELKALGPSDSELTHSGFTLG